MEDASEIILEAVPNVRDEMGSGRTCRKKIIICLVSKVIACYFSGLQFKLLPNLSSSLARTGFRVRITGVYPCRS